MNKSGVCFRLSCACVCVEVCRLFALVYGLLCVLQCYVLTPVLIHENYDQIPPDFQHLILSRNLQVYKLRCFPSPQVSVGINKRRPSLWLAQQQALYSLWFDVLYKDVALWMPLMVLLLLAEYEPLCSKGLTPAHAICMKLLDNGEGSEHAARSEYKCSGRVSAGCGALSRPPEAMGGVSWWPADCAKWSVLYDYEHQQR